MVRWTSIELDFIEETANFGTRHEFGIANSLYQLQTLATITPSSTGVDKEIDEKNENKNTLEGVNLNSECNGKWLAVAVQNDLSFFLFGFKFQFKFSFSFDSPVMGLSWLPNSDILAVGCENGHFSFISATREIVLYRKKIPCEKRLLSLKSFQIKLDCILSATFFDGQQICIFLPDFSFALKTLANNDFCALRKVINDIHIESRFFDFPISDCEIFTHSATWLLLPNCAEKPLKLVGIYDEFTELFIDSRDNFGYKRVRVSKCSRFIFILGMDHRLSILDNLTSMFIFEQSIPNMIDFVQFEYCESPSKLADFQLIVLVENDGHNLVQIRTLPLLEVVYSVVLNSQVCLLATFAEEDHLLLVVELARGETRWKKSAPNLWNLNSDSVRIRSIAETQPELKLSRFLAKCQFEQAEKFARQFGLDGQVVLTTKMNVLLQELQTDEADGQKFDAFLKCLGEILDDDLVAMFGMDKTERNASCNSALDQILETCISGCTLLHHRRWIESLLDFSSSRSCSDPAILHQFDRLRFNLATYLLIFHPADPSFSSDSPWLSFVGDQSWLSILQQCIVQGTMLNVSLIWTRYEALLASELDAQSNGWSTILDVLKNSILSQRQPFDEIVSFFRCQFVPCYLLSGAFSANRLICWLSQLARLVETADFDNFPQNSLDLLSLVDKCPLELVEKAVTPKQMANAVLICAEMTSEMQNCSLDVDVKDLQKLHTLSTVYECKMSLQQFKKETRESICYRILDRVQTVEMLPFSVNKFATPYMQQQKLNSDDTLLRYIEEIAQNASDSISCVNPWQDRCLAILDSIISVDIRLKSLIIVVRRAKLPWSANLISAEQNVRKQCKNEQLLIQLQKQCDFSQIRHIFAKYSVPLMSLNKALISPWRFERLLVNILNRDKFDTDDNRLKDILKVIEMNPLITNIDIFVTFAFRLLQKVENDNLSPFIAFLNSIEQKEREKVFEKLLLRLKLRLNTEFLHSMQRRHLLYIEALLCLLGRFLKSENYPILTGNLNCLRLLLTKFRISITLKQMNDFEFRKNLLIQFVTAEIEAKSWPQVIEFSRSLGLQRCTTCKIALKCAISIENPQLILHISGDLLSNSKSISITTEIVAIILDAFAEILRILSDFFDDHCQEVVHLMGIISNLTPKLVHFCVENQLLTKLLKLSSYLDLFLQISCQCQDEQNSTVCSRTISHNRDYLFHFDGVVFDKMSLIKATTLLGRRLLDDDDQSDAAWSNLQSLLSLASQTYLELVSRCVHHRLSASRHDCDTLTDCVETLCSKLLCRPSCDWHLALFCLMVLPRKRAGKLLGNLRQRSVQNHAHHPQTVFNLVHVGMTFAGICGDSSLKTVLKEAYKWSFWSKKLAKFGLKFSPTRDVGSIVPLFSRHKVPVSLLTWFTSDFDLDPNSAYCNHAVALIKHCNAVGQCADNSCAKMAEFALRQAQVSVDLLEKLFDALRRISSYRYDLIDFLVKMIGIFNTDGAILPVKVDKLTDLFKFLCSYRRRQPPGDVEQNWYHERVSKLNRSYRQVNDLNEGDWSSDFIEEDKLPALSMDLLPFHIFLPGHDSTGVLQSVLIRESCLENVLLWRSFVSRLSILRISQSQLLMEAVEKAVIRSGEISQEKLADIGTLLNENVGTDIAVKCIALIVKQMPLGSTKIRFVQLGVDLAEKWLKSNDPNMTKESMEQAEKYIDVLKEALRTFRSELLLKNAHMLNSTTENLVRTPAKLIFHLYEMTDSEFVDDYNGMISKMAELNQIDLKKIHSVLFDKLLISKMNSENDAFSGVDSNQILDTIDGSNSGIPNKSSSDFILPYHDVNITRLLQILRHRDRKQAAYSLVTILNQDTCTLSGGFSAKIRALCCLFRLLSIDEIKSVLNISAQKLGDKMQSLLYAHLLELCSLNIKMSAFESGDKLALAKFIWFNSGTQNAQTIRLVISLSVDFCLLDSYLNQSLLSKIHLTPQNGPLLGTLLTHFSKYDHFPVENLAIFWTRLVHSLIDSKGDLNSNLQAAFLMLASCPTEGGAGFDSVIATFNSHGAKKLAEYSKILANSTRREKFADKCKTNTENF